MKFVILAFLFLVSNGFAATLGPAERAFAKRQADTVAAEFQRGDLQAVAARTDQALNNLVGKAVLELHKKGHHTLAIDKEAEWNLKFRGFLSSEMRARAGGHIGDIGDHKPLIQWLADFYDKVEGVLGVDVCKMFRISDIKTFNFCIPVAFSPCTFDMGKTTISRRDEYRMHMQKGAVLNGLLPVTTYWACDIACMVGTSGIAVFFCGPVASIAEAIMAGPISGMISDKIFDRACGP